METKYRVEIGYCVECKFFKPIQSATESGDKCWLRLAPAGKDGEMLVDPNEFGCIAWKESTK